MADLYDDYGNPLTVDNANYGTLYGQTETQYPSYIGDNVGTDTTPPSDAESGGSGTSATGTSSGYESSAGSISSSSPTTLSGLWNKIANGTFSASDVAKYMAANPGTSAGVMALLAQLMGANQKTTGGYSGTIPKLTASRQQIQYNDPNRRPGAQGRQYFTDVNYTGASTAPQAEGILANYTPAAAPVSKWNAANAVATPWAKPAVAAPATSVAPVMTPEQKLASLQEPIKAATGRYLQGPTDGMADELNTSIDNKQPAKLSHGEFVVPADVVSHLGNGNSDAGARKLYAMMDKVRVARTGTKKQGKKINPDKFMPGGNVNKYAKGGIAELPVKKFEVGGKTGPATDTTTTSTLSPWAGDYVTGMLGQGQALANQPYQAYTGPLTAGPSDLQEQQFAGLSNLAQTGLTPTQFSAGTFDTTQANKYMNPYIQTALDPQLKEMQRQADIARLSDAGRLTKAGAYGGSRQAIMESEGRRNLLEKQGQAIGTGYKNAYDAAMAQFNAEQNRGLDVQRAQEAANEASAAFGLKSLDALGQAGATQRGIASEGIAADKAQFEEQRDYPYKMVQYQQGLLQGLPITTQSNTQNMSPLTSFLSTLGYSDKLLQLLGVTPTPTASTGTTATKSAGTT